MLNELCQLADILDEMNIQPKEWHAQLKLLPKVSVKKPCYKICITKDGTINSVELLNKELVSILRKWEPDNGSSFPGFNIKPFYQITGADEKKRLKLWRDGKEDIDVLQLRKWCTIKSSNWDEKIENKLIKCLRIVPEKLGVLFGSDDSQMAVTIRKLLNRVSRFPQANDDGNSCDNPFPKGFKEVLEDYLWQAITEGDQAKILLSVLINEGDDGKKSKNDGVSVFLDISDWKEFPVAHLKSVELMNDVLINQPVQSTDLCDVIDAYGVI